MDTICINCPNGCSLHIEDVNGKIVVTGNICEKGKSYGEDEYSHPKRSLTALVHSSSGKIFSCKISKPVSKDKIRELAKYLKTVSVDDSLDIEDVAISNVMGLGVDLIITSKK